MSRYDYDLFVLGAGSGGVRAARMAASLGVKVAVAEQDRTGGTCVNLGCVPKKLYVHAAEYASLVSQASNYGWQFQPPGFDWTTLRDNKSAFITNANLRMEAMLEKAGARLIRGRATLNGPHEVLVDGRLYSAERILVATGAHPSRPEFPGKEHVLSSDQIFDLDHLPERLLIIGGGYIACEFAGIFHHLGVKVTQLYRGELFLRGFDREIRQKVAADMRRAGIDLRFNTQVEKIVKTSVGQYAVECSQEAIITTDLILGATGRRPNVENLGLESAGVKVTPQGAIAVNRFYQTNVPSIYALGDVIDRLQLTPVALAEAMTLVDFLYKDKAEPLDYNLIPTAVFSLPQIAGVGVSEEQAIERFSCVDVYTSEFRSLKQALAGHQQQILMKLLVDADTQRVVGAHMAGEGAAETIQGIAIALKAGATKATFDKTVGIHPTSAEEFVTMRALTRTHRQSDEKGTRSQE